MLKRQVFLLSNRLRYSRERALQSLLHITLTSTLIGFLILEPRSVLRRDKVWAHLRLGAQGTSVRRAQVQVERFTCGRPRELRLRPAVEGAQGARAGPEREGRWIGPLGCK